MLHKLVDRTLVQFWPYSCILCGGKARAIDLCHACGTDLPWLQPACTGCGTPLPGAPERCGACITSPAPYEYCLPALRYEYPVDRLITGLKYQQRMPYARVLGELLATVLRDCFNAGKVRPPELLVPVPLHVRRLAERGFNQAEEIGRCLSRLLAIEMRHRLCERVRDTPGQIGLGAVDRRRNLRNGFAICEPLHGARIAIVDDVITTGTTAVELSKALRRAGAAEIQIWSVARALA